MSEQNRRKLGEVYEKFACDFLRQKGLCILETNFRVRQGEIDIVARDGNTLVFAEVKYRKNKTKGTPEEAVGIRKQIQISKVAMFYLAFHHLPLTTLCRFDVIAICNKELHWIPNAFPFRWERN
ncbi:MAG: YraN family protein [Lachnospiraceae bacterium]|nr:YraN family protein [Lachnospiraceae bacterium]